MAIENLVAVGATAADSRAGHGLGGNVKGWTRTIEISASASDTSTYTLGYVPANARILGISRYSIDDCDTGSTATLDIGLYAVDGNITSDVDALTDGIAMGTAAKDQPLVKTIEKYGKRAWELVSGATVATKGDFRVAAVIDDGDISAAGGTLTVELFYLVP
jgi:hypothetical protein